MDRTSDKRNLGFAGSGTPEPLEMPQGERYGLVVGIDQYSCSRLNLRYAERDALSMYKLMVDKDCGEFKQGHVLKLLNENATRKNLCRQLSSICRWAKPQDTVWIYFAGHAAVEDGKPYWVLHDSDPEDLRGSGMSKSSLEEFYVDIKAKKRVVFLDCCNAGAFGKKGARDGCTPIVGARETSKMLQQSSVMATFSACTPFQAAYENEVVGHGAFTEVIVEGLIGKADIDRDGHVSLLDLWQYINQRAKDLPAWQIPQIDLSGLAQKTFLLTKSVAAMKSRRQRRQRAQDLQGRLMGWYAENNALISGAELDFIREILNAHPPWSEDCFEMVDGKVEDLLDGKLEARTFCVLLKYAYSFKDHLTLPHCASEKNVADGGPKTGTKPHGFGSKPAAPADLGSHPDWLAVYEQMIPVGTTTHRQLNVAIRSFRAMSHPVAASLFEQFAASSFFTAPKTIEEKNRFRYMWTDAGLKWIGSCDKPTFERAHCRGCEKLAPLQIVCNVNWYVAAAFCNWLTYVAVYGGDDASLPWLPHKPNGETDTYGNGFRLPTLAEMEVLGGLGRHRFHRGKEWIADHCVSMQRRIAQVADNPLICFPDGTRRATFDWRRGAVALNHHTAEQAPDGVVFRCVFTGETSREARA